MSRIPKMINTFIFIILTGMTSEYWYEQTWILHLIIILYSLTMINICKNSREINKTNSENKYYVLYIFLMYSILSFFWSFNQLESIKLLLILMAGASFAIYTNMRYSGKEIINLIRSAGIVTILSTLIIYILGREFVIHLDYFHYGAVKGLFLHKNLFGSILVIYLITFEISLMGNKFKRKNRWILDLILIILTFIFIVMSDSVTSLVISILMSIFIFFKMKVIDKFRNLDRFVIYVILLITILFSAIIIGLYLNNVLIFLGKDETLTGRTDIWYLTFKSFLENVYFGKGIGGIWYYGNDLTFKLNQIIGIDIFSSHNGYIDLLLSLGVVGGVLFSLIIFIGVFNIIKMFSLDNISNYQLLLAQFFLFFLTINLFENRFLTSTAVFMYIFCLCYLGLRTNMKRVKE